MTEQAKRLSRRNFFLGAGAASAAAAAMISAKQPSARAPGKDKRATHGYHDTQHINNYYRTAKV
jgi:hypothetical protein